MSNDVYLAGQTFYESLNEILADEQYIFMQSTGLRDENKTEVFQSDIVWHDQNEEYGVVEFDEAKFVIRWKNGYVEDLFERIDLLEVVGHIHEHPGLLEEDGE